VKKNWKREGWEKAKLKQKKNQTEMIDFWLSLFVIHGDVIRSPCLIWLCDTGMKDFYLD
jgi:hypothetical protein